MPSPQALTINLLEEFPLEPGLIYLNHAALSPWPNRTANAIREFADENLHRGCTRYSIWLDVERRLRQRITRLINAPGVDDIALQKNTSEAISAVAFGLAWQAGENVVLARDEFPTNRWPWEALADKGVEARLVDTAGSPQPERQLIAAADEKTRLIAISSVAYATGVRADLGQLGRFCRSNGILLGVDAIQSLGALPIDVQAENIDFLACGAHKWLMAPEGLSFLYCRESLRSQLRLNQFGWRMTDDPFTFGQAQTKPSASGKRFESGTLNTLGMLGLDASLSLIEDLSVQSVTAKVLDNSSFIFDRLQEIRGLQVLTPREADRHAGIISFKANDVAATRKLFGALKDANITTALRENCLRLSPHFYTPREHLETTIDCIARYSGK